MRESPSQTAAVPLMYVAGLLCAPACRLQPSAMAAPTASKAAAAAACWRRQEQRPLWGPLATVISLLLLASETLGLTHS